MITVACVLKSGGDYGTEYVRRLKEGVDRNLDGHRFVCLSDVAVPCERIPLQHDFPGWWAKLELFYLEGPVLFFDLDTVIAGDLEVIANYPHRFTAIDDFYRPRRLQSNVMAWADATPWRHLIEVYRNNPKAAGRSHQKWIEPHVKPIQFFQDLFPREFVSYKATKSRRGASVICYHGKPRPHQTGWAV